MQHLIKFLLILFCFQACTPGKNNPDTFLIQSRTLIANQQRIKSGDATLTDALSRLIADADQAMNNGPYSVTYKSKVPPSGDKRDYMSVGPYWWPDPNKPDGLPYIRHDGEVNPERFEIRDAEYFKDLCRDIRLFTLARFYTDDKKYADKAIELLRVWFIDEQTAMNPNLNYGQSIPGITEGRGIGLIDTRAVVYLIDGIQLLKYSGDLGQKDKEVLEKWFGNYYEWLTTSPIGLDEADEHNNHGTYYDVQAISIALFIGKKEEAAKMIEGQTKKRIESQLAEDGSQPHELARTLSWNYSVMNLHGFFELASLAEKVDIDLWNYESPEGKSIRKAYFWFLPYAVGEKNWEYKQIKPAGKSGFVELSRVAYGPYRDERIRSYLEANKNEKVDAVTLLTIDHH